MAGKTGKTGGSPSGGGFGGAVRSAGSRGASYITASQGRQTAFLLIIAIFLARLALTHQLQAFWAAMWGQSRPLGSALPKNVAAANSTTSNTASQPNVTSTQAQTNTTVAPVAVAPGPLDGVKSVISRIFGGA